MFGCNVSYKLSAACLPFRQQHRYAVLSSEESEEEANDACSPVCASTSRPNLTIHWRWHQQQQAEVCKARAVGYPGAQRSGTRVQDTTGGGGKLGLTFWGSMALL